MLDLIPVCGDNHHDLQSAEECTMHTCPHCSSRVLAKADGTCPACGSALGPGTNESVSVSTAAATAPAEPSSPFRSEQHRRMQMKIDIFFGTLVVLIAVLGIGVMGYILDEESVSTGALASCVTLGVLALGAFCASRGVYWLVYGIVSFIVFAWACYVIVTKGSTWTPYFFALNAEVAFAAGGKVYAQMIAKWHPGGKPG